MQHLGLGGGTCRALFVEHCEHDFSHVIFVTAHAASFSRASKTINSLPIMMKSSIEFIRDVLEIRALRTKLRDLESQNAALRLKCDALQQRLDEANEKISAHSNHRFFVLSDSPRRPLGPR
jgi:hypothetical protein